MLFRSTKEEASSYIDLVKRQIVQEHMNFDKYVNEFVDKIDVPEWINYEDWSKFARYHGKKIPYLHDEYFVDKGPKRFKETLISVLTRSGFTYDDPNYQPPIRSGYRQLFVIEIPN